MPATRPLLPALLLAAACLLSGSAAAATRAAGGDGGGLYEDALQRFNSGEFDAAVVQLKNVLQENPGNLPARILLGRAYLRQGQGASAEKELELAQRSGADEKLILLPLANAYLLQGKFQEILQRIHSSDPALDGSPEVLTIRGQAHLKLEQLDEAQQSFERAARQQSAYAAPLLGLARVALRRGEPARAEDLVDEATSRSPADPDAWYLKGELRRLRGDDEGALEFYGRTIELDPGHLPARNSRATVLIGLGRDDAAREDVEFVLAEAPHDPQAAYLRALLASRSGDEARAREALEQAAESIDRINPEVLQRDPASLLLAGLVRFAQGRFQQARSQLDRYVQLQPYQPGARKLLAAVHITEGNAQAAIDTLLPALKMTPEDAEVLGLLGDAYMRNAQYDLAREMLSRAAEKDPERAGLRSHLALVRLAQGDSAGAVEELEAALARRPDSTRMRVLLGLLRIRDGDYPGAIEIARAMGEADRANPALVNLEGAAHLAAGDSAAARRSFEQALEIEPRYVPAQHNLAKLDLAAGDFEAARGRYAAILEHHPGEIPAMLGMARAFTLEGRPADAVTWLEKARAADLSAREPRLRLVELYLRTDQAQKALTVALELEDLDATDLEALAAVGSAYLALQQKDQAAATFRRMSKYAGHSARDLYRVAQYQLQAGDSDGAYWSLQKAANGDGDYLPARAALVRLEAKLGKYDAALEHVAALRSEHPGTALPEVLEGDVRMAMDEYGRAVSAYEAARGIHADTDVTVRLYRALLASGAGQQAMSLVEEWVAAHPDDDTARRLLASAYIDAGRYARAAEEHRALLAEHPDDAAVLNNLAWLSQKTGDPRALDYADRARALAPDDPATLDTFGWVLVQSGDAGRGLKYLREAYSRMSTDARIRYHLAVALERLGRRDEARGELERALAADPDFDGADEARALLQKLSAAAGQ